MALAWAFGGATVPKEKTGSAMGLLGTMSAVGTALGPSLGGVLIAVTGWRAIFLINVPLGLLAILLAHRYLADDRAGEHGPSGMDRSDFDIAGTLLLAITLGTYALAMTIGRSHIGPSNIALLSVAVLGAGLFVFVETKVASPLLSLSMFRDSALGKSLAMNVVVSTVMMATLVVGPFYLSRALGLGSAAVGIVMSVGPVTSALSGVLAGRIVDRFGAPWMIVIGLIQMAVGTCAVSFASGILGISGYVIAILILSPGYQLFQAANNTTVMMNVGADQRGVVSGMLSLSRNLGLITGAAAMGAVFAFASGSPDVATAAPEAVASGMRTTFAIATVLVVVAIALARREEITSRA
jgi:MFS family permease